MSAYLKTKTYCPYCLQTIIFNINTSQLQSNKIFTQYLKHTPKNANHPYKILTHSNKYIYIELFSGVAQ